jgi:hypothetical protein
MARERLPSEDLIQLPRFDSTGAVALGDRLLAVAFPADLPSQIQKAREDLGRELASLRLAAEARLAAAEATNPEELAASDQSLDTSWTALFDWLTGFSKLPDGTPQAEEARTLLAELYPEGLSFILLPYELEWSQSDTRLLRMANEPLGDRIRALGGQVFISAITAAHRDYGKVLGLRRKAPEKEASGQVNLHEALEGFTAALRIYALLVTAHVELEEPGTGTMAKVLLGPLLSWRGKTGELQ